MARPRTTDAASKDNNTQAKPCWKDRLTEQQLSKKRATDRLLVRENRNRARRTIAILQERLDLLSNQLPDKVISDLLRVNAGLVRDKEILKDRLNSLHVAAGISREGSRELISKLLPNDADSGTADQCSDDCIVVATECQESRPQEKSKDDPAVPQPQIRTPAPAEVETDDQNVTHELDIRTALPGSTSPFPQMYATMDQTKGMINFCDDEFIESIMLWKLASSNCRTVIELASRLYHVHRFPSYLSQNKLSSITATPGVLQMLVDDLEFPELRLDIGPVTPPLSTTASETSTVTIVKRELIVCAFEAIRPWKYCSHFARITMFWALYRILTLLTFPTPRNLARCPVWYRPLLAQMWHPHAAFVDFLPWPGIRAQLVQDWQSYETRNLFSAFVENFDIQPSSTLSAGRLVQLDCDGVEVIIDPQFEQHIQSLTSLGMYRGFIDKFPEFSRFVHVLPSKIHIVAEYDMESSTGAEVWPLAPRPANAQALNGFGSDSCQALSSMTKPTGPAQVTNPFIPGSITLNPAESTSTFLGLTGTCITVADDALGEREDAQSCRESVKTLSTGHESPEAPSNQATSNHAPLPVHSTSQNLQSSGVANDFSLGFNTSFEADHYHLDPALTEFNDPVPWSIQRDGASLNNFMFSV